MQQQIEVGSEVIATMGRDSFYRQVRGTVTGFRNGFVQIVATRVLSKWDADWTDHPTSCRCAAPVGCVVAA